MLNNEDKQKIEKHFDKLIDSILNDAKDSINSGTPKKQVIDDCLKATVNKITPESKALVYSVYNMLKQKTFEEEFFTNSSNKAAFNQMNLGVELNEKFNFEIPSKIDYEESEKKINNWKAMGIITVAGGVISIILKKATPIMVAIVIAGIMGVILKNKEEEKNDNLENIIKEYLENVKKSLLAWVDSIAEYYDERVEELKSKLK